VRIIATLTIAVLVIGCSDPGVIPDKATEDARAIRKPMTPLQLEGLRSVLNRCRIRSKQPQCVNHELRRLSEDDRMAVKRALPASMLGR
jgi:hypothetical protein